MSKALRIAMDDVPFARRCPTVLNWHPFYVDTSGQNTPCLPEFISLMQCLHHVGMADECSFQYKNLLRCLYAHGLKK